MNLKWFTLSEFDSPDKKGSGSKMNPAFLKILDELRDRFGKPMKINSGYRTEKHNKKIGGVKDSSHMKGLAVDVSITNSQDRFHFLKCCFQLGITRIGVANSFIHIDIDDEKPKKVIWTYK
ncbi:MAG: putative peptidase M15 [Prokaryotic dsDNA virus sp.]|nr:MAG: putative peptidase M15 [Prokaryotic dsDNA virus sp.]|tara:strand:+ start:449 stop:811 length:363 start_codon:yes stop_codon:yes gene_type:complete